jgi:hypothetical protein
MCIEYIYRHIRQLPPTQIFTTREMLIYGTRSAVDAALHRMVKSQFIVRLARGVFVRDESCRPSLSEIVAAKAKAFGIKIVKHAETMLQELKIRQHGDDSIFAKNGSSSSFWTIRGRAYLKSMSARKIDLCETKVGRIIYALWHLGLNGCSRSDVWLASNNLGRSERNQLWLATSKMPDWLSRICRPHYSAGHITVHTRAELAS